MESKKETAPKKKRSLLGKAWRVVAWILVSVIFLVILLLLLIQTAPVQNFARKKIVGYLENKLKTRVEIGKLDIKFPTSLSLQNIYFEDQAKDTLIYGEELRVNISMFKLLKSEININEIYLDNIVGKVKRLPPDSTFNFQFIVDAFAGSKPSTPAKQDTSSLKINIDRIIVKNTRIVYKDAFTGNDMDLAIGNLDTRISTFDPTHMIFNVPDISLKGLKGHYYQLVPLQQSIAKSVAVASAEPENYLQFINKNINFSDINLVYKSDPSHMNASFIVGDVTIHPKKFDLKNGAYALNDIALNNSGIAVATDSKKQTKPAADTLTDAAAAAMPFKFIADDIKINNSNIKYDDQSAPHVNKGMDFSHMNISGLTLNVSNIQYTADTTLASVKSLSFKEQSGFALNNFTTDFSMYPSGVSLKNLLIQTPGTEMTTKRSAVITYPSLAAIQKNPGEMGLDIDVQNSKIAVKDILNLAPQMSAQLSSLSPASTLYVDARITGKVSDLNFQRLMLKGLSGTDINATGSVKGLPDPKKVSADLSIKKFQTTKKDIMSFLPKGTLPPNITLPETIAASGTIKGGMENLNTDVAITTSLGSAKIKGTLINITDSNKAHYDLTLNARSLQLGTLMQNPQLSSLSGDFKVKGKGYNPKTANATFSGFIPNITLNEYNYTNIKADGSIAHKAYKINASVHDPNISADLSADGIFSGKFPGVHLKATIDSIQAKQLNLSTTTLNYHGDIDGDFSSTDPDNLSGKLLITHSILVTDSQRITVDSLQLIADNSNGRHSLSVQSDFLSLAIKGQYKLTQLADVFQQAIDPYFSLTDKKNTAKVDPYNFSIEGGAVDNAALRAFAPDLKQLKPITLNGHFASDSGWNVYIKSPYIVYGTNTIDDVNITAGTRNGALAFNTSVKQVIAGTSLSVYATTLVGTLQNNKIDFTLNIKDKKEVNKYTLSGLLSQPSANNYSFSLKPENLLLNYAKWSINADNSIQYFNKDVAAHNFILSQGNQELGLNTIGTVPNSPLQIDFKNFKIETITGFIQSDSLFVNGLLNGNAVVKNIQTQPTFTTDLTINDLSIYKDTIGNFTAKVNNNVANTFEANVGLTGRGNQVTVNGNYIVKAVPANSSYDFNVDIAALQMKSIEGFTKGGIKDARGFLSGKIALNGDLKSPNIDGKINFNDVAFNASTVNSVFRVDKEAIAVINNKGIEFDKFTIRDTVNNALVIDGNVNTPDFFNYTFDLTLKADHFQAINSTVKNNNVFYGKFVFSTDLSITGTPQHPVVDGDLTVDDKTNFTVVLPQADPGIQSREGVVKFVDYSATAEDSVLMTPIDSLKTAPLIGYDVSININVSKEAMFNVIVDQANGDFLKLKGTAELTAGIDASGKINMVGSYEIEEGSYDLSFNLIKRKFLIQKGSRIVWTGDPTSAQLDVTALYVANTAPSDLVQQTSSNIDATYKQKLPFEVHLILKGELLKPDITFDIILPEDKNYNVSKAITDNVQNKLAEIRQEPGEMNKQVFALLLLNRFVGDNPFNSSGGSTSASTLAKESVSKLLSQQLNNLTQNLIQGVDINFDLATTEDYTTGSEQDRTDLNVGISKNLLSDRLTVTVGNDFQLEGPQVANSGQNNLAGNISINYKLSKDGKYVLRAYRKADNTGTIEGYVIETGLGFIISVDYNRFREIFLSKEMRNKKKQIKKENKEEPEKSSAMKAESQHDVVSEKPNEN